MMALVRFSIFKPSLNPLLKKARFLFMWALGMWLPVFSSGTLQVSEYEVKAAFLYNFARFVQWPESSPLMENNAIVIAVAGRPDIADILRKTLSGQTLEGRSVSVTFFGKEDPIPPCHLLFVPLSEESDISHLLRHLQGSKTLTVGESRRFIPQGGMVSFFTERGRIRFAVNLNALEKAGLKASSQMLQYARIEG